VVEHPRPVEARFLAEAHSGEQLVPPEAVLGDVDTDPHRLTVSPSAFRVDFTTVEVVKSTKNRAMAATDLIPELPMLDALTAAAAGCRACELWGHGTRTV